jgi:hypothetical protein
MTLEGVPLDVASVADIFAAKRPQRRRVSDERYDYEYELTDEQLLRYAELPPIDKLRWLDQARRFTLLGRHAREALGREGGDGSGRARRL